MGKKYTGEAMVSLDKTDENCIYIVKKIDAGKRLYARLSDLAILEGSRIKVISSRHGPVILKVLDSKIAIGRGQAQKIYVSKICD